MKNLSLDKFLTKWEGKAPARPPHSLVTKLIYVKRFKLEIPNNSEFFQSVLLERYNWLDMIALDPTGEIYLMRGKIIQKENSTKRKRKTARYKLNKQLKAANDYIVDRFGLNPTLIGVISTPEKKFMPYRFNPN